MSHVRGLGTTSTKKNGKRKGDLKSHCYKNPGIEPTLVSVFKIEVFSALQTRFSRSKYT